MTELNPLEQKVTADVIRYMGSMTKILSYSEETKRSVLQQAASAFPDAGFSELQARLQKIVGDTVTAGWVCNKRVLGLKEYQRRVNIDAVSSSNVANGIFDDSPVDKAVDIAGLRLGGYDAKIVSKKKCPTELAFNHIPDIAAQAVEHSEFTQSLFSEGNHFEDALMDQINASALRGKSSELNCPIGAVATKKDQAEFKAALRSMRTGVRVIALIGEEDRDQVAAGEITYEQSSRAAREFATKELLRNPGDIKVLMNPRLPSPADNSRVGEPDFILRSETDLPNNKPAWLGVDAKMHGAIDFNKKSGKGAGRIIDANGSKVEYVMEYVTLADMGLGRNVSGTLRQGGRAKMEDALQLSHYRDMLAAGGFGRADEQYGYVIGKALAGLSFVAVRMDLTALVYSAADGTINAESAEEAYKRGFTKAAQIVRNAKDHGIYPRPMVNALCGECVYAPTCEQIWEENDEVTRIAGVTPKIAETKLADLGITTVAELAHLPLGTDKLDKHIDFARVYDAARESGKVYAYRRRGLPSVQIDSRPVALFVDMENSVSLQDELFDPKASQIVYQWGMHLVNYQVDADNKVIGEKYNDVASVKAKHLQFDDFTHTDEGELKVFLEMWETAQKARAAAIRKYKTPKAFGFYVWSAAETRIMRHLVNKHLGAPGVPTLDELEAFIKAHVIDQLAIMRDMLIVPTASYSIKDVAKMILSKDGTPFSWPMSDAGGAASTQWYAKAVDGDLEQMQKVRDYNKADTEIQVQIWNQLIRVARSLKDSGFKPVERLDKFYNGETTIAEVNFEAEMSK